MILATDGRPGNLDKMRTEELMSSQVVRKPNGIFVWIDQPFEDNAIGFINEHLLPVSKEEPLFIFIERSGSGDMESYFFDMHRWGYNVKFRAMNRADARMLDTLKLPTHDLDWPG